MNAEDKARLDELTLRVYAQSADNILNGGDTHSSKGWLHAGEIESHGGRQDKALRLLLKANVIALAGKVGEYGYYRIVNMELARSLEHKPEDAKKWIALEDEVKNAESSINLAVIDYEAVKYYAEAEQLYIYFHQDEFDVKVRDGTNYYYLKEHVERRDKFVLKNIVELELKYHFSKYINMFAKTELVCDQETQTFKFPRYCISTVFEQDELDEIFEDYKANYEEMLNFMTSLNQTLKWVKDIGGFDVALRVMRKQIINDIIKQEVRFHVPKSYTSWDSSYQLGRVFAYTKRVQHLLDYDTLYVGDEMEGEMVRDVFTKHGAIDMEGFDEPGNEGSDIQEQAA